MESQPLGAVKVVVYVPAAVPPASQTSPSVPGTALKRTLPSAGSPVAFAVLQSDEVTDRGTVLTFRRVVSKTSGYLGPHLTVGRKHEIDVPALDGDAAGGEEDDRRDDGDKERSDE